MFSRERNGKRQEIRHFLHDKNSQPHLFMSPDKAQIEQKFDEFIENTKGEIEHWSEEGSGWEVERITIAYVDVEIYRPIPGGTYLPLPAWLANKKAIINVENRDNERLKWALRAALFPPKDRKNVQRTSKYPVNDGINYEGIDFPTPVKQIDKLEAQNKNLAITVFGYENNHVYPIRLSDRREEKKVKQINLTQLISISIAIGYCFMLITLHKSGLAEKSQKILQRCERQADKDCDARGGEKHPFLPKSSQTDEDALCDLCGV